MLAPRAPGEVVFGNAGNDRFLGSSFGDVFRPGTGADVARLGAGADRVIGTAAELDGDRIEDLTVDDAIVVEGVRLDRRFLEVDTSGWVLRLDADRSGSFETAIDLDGDFSAGRFLVLPSTSGPATTTIRYTLDPNLAPVAVDDTASTAGAPVVIDILANDSDPDGALDPASVTITAPPAFGTVVDNGDGTLTYTPEAGRTGVVSLRYTVEDVEGAVSNEATVTIRLGPEAIVGTCRADILVGTVGADLIRALAGGDIVDAGAGDDRVLGGDGYDLLRGGDGRDILHGGNGGDILQGGAGDDILLGAEGRDALEGGAGVDVAVFLRARADYRVLGVGPNRTVQALQGNESTDTLTGIERIQFKDGWLDTATNTFAPGFANAEVEALLTGADPWIQP